MNYCPNCGTILKENEDTCPNCNTKIIIEDNPSKEVVKEEKKEPTKKPPQKKTKPQKRTKYKTQKVEVKEIPLTVKKTSKHKASDKSIEEYMLNNREDVDKYYKQDEIAFNISSIIKIVAVVLLFILTVYIIFHTAIDSSKKTTITSSSNTNKVTIYNSWESNSGGEFLFKKDNTFYWFKTSNDNQNYYSGKYTFKTGIEAVNDMGYDEKEFRKIFGDDILLEDVYSIEITPNKAIIDGKDVTSTSIKPNTKWWYILIIRPDGSAMSYNKTLDSRYDLKIKTD